MFRMYASNFHSYTHLIPALGIVRKPTVWGFITSEYPDIHDTSLASIAPCGTLQHAAHMKTPARDPPIRPRLDCPAGAVHVPPQG